MPNVETELDEYKTSASVLNLGDGLAKSLINELISRSFTPPAGIRRDWHTPSGNIWPSHIQFKAKSFAGSTWWNYWGVARILEQNKSSQLVTIINNYIDMISPIIFGERNQRMMRGLVIVSWRVRCRFMHWGAEGAFYALWQKRGGFLGLESLTRATASCQPDHQGFLILNYLRWGLNTKSKNYHFNSTWIFTC